MTESNASGPETDSNHGSAEPEQELSDEAYLEQRSAQAMVATYLQMARYAKLARALQKARLRSTTRRLERTSEMDQAVRLRRQLYAQTHQGASLDNAVARLRRRAEELRAFPEAGMTPEELSALGLDSLLAPDDPEANLEREGELVALAPSDEPTEDGEAFEAGIEDESSDRVRDEPSRAASEYEEPSIGGARSHDEEFDDEDVDDEGVDDAEHPDA